MPRYAGGRRQQRIIRGVEHLVFEHLVKMNAGYCLRPWAEDGAVCRWCEWLGDLDAGAVELPGSMIFGALTSRDGLARAHADLQGDVGLWSVHGDLIQQAADVG